MLAILVISSCSVKKNTASSRAFHNLTTRYNILFNGTESFKKGMLNLQASYQDNYTELLPFFLYTDPDQLGPISGDMERSIKKSTKIISYHSITAKPEIKDVKLLSQKEREFYSKKEFNKWMDEAYLLMAKAHLYKNDKDKALETLSYLMSNYADETTISETKLWLARIAIQDERKKEADEYLSELSESKDLSKELESELQVTIAHQAYLAKDYQKAIASLKKAIDKTPSKYFKQRYTYIVAQLYQKIMQVGKAAEYYKAVIKLNPPYEMTFNARINMALTYESGAGSLRVIEKELQKMLKDDKNIEYQDQIYYAWGNLYTKAGQPDKAVEYYLKSAAASAGNVTQLAQTYLTVADIYYEQPNYVSAQSYYDSAVAIIDVSYPDYKLIYAKSISLTNLVTHIQSVELNDSVLELAKLPRPELLEHIDKLIELEKERKEEERQRKFAEAQQSNLGTQQQYELQSKKGSDWYFYNPTSLNLGRQEFKLKWGPRKLEDNWRRKNKSTVSYEIASDNALEGEGELEGTAKTPKGTQNTLSREYYLMNIPFTDSARTASNDKIRDGLFEMGGIYSSELEDYEKAKNAYSQLLKRYPNYSNKLLVYYKMYTIGKETNDKSLVTSYKQKIISEYPKSNYAMVLSDPNYFMKMEEEAKQLERTYAVVFEKFNNRRFAEVARMSKKAIEDNPEHELIPQFNYMLTVSEGVSKDTSSFIGDLQKLISHYPGSEIADNATQLISFLQDINPEAAVKQEIKQAVELFGLNLNEEHFAVVSLPKKSSGNQMMFNIINFNLDNVEEEDLKVRKFDLKQASLLSVNKFKNAQKAKAYLEQLRLAPILWRDVEMSGAELFVISRSNYEILKTTDKLNQYLLYYKGKY